MRKAIVVTGATGFVGRRLSLALFRKGYHLRLLCRSPEHAKLQIPLPVEFVAWEADSIIDPAHLEGAEAIIHLAGAPIAEGRWSRKRKRQILSTRIGSSENLVVATKKCQTPPKVFIGASAIGLYGHRHDEILNENSNPGGGFLADVCVRWEKAQADFPGRRVSLRTGVVLGHGGALKKMQLPFRLGLGGRLGLGRQWMSWIHIDDLVSLYIFALENDSLEGPVNAVAPGPLTNRSFTKELAQTLGVPAVLPLPSLALRILFGEMSSVLSDSQRVLPSRAVAAGFSYRFPSIVASLGHLLKPRGIAGGHVFESYQWFSQEKSEVFTFFSRAENLEAITPPWLNFRITRKSHESIQEGTIIDYRLKIKGVPAKWRTLITRWSPPHEFMDSQLKGPYAIWDHIHRFEEVAGGTLMSDEVVYRVPFGPIGHVVNEFLIRQDVTTIFDHRTSSMSKFL